MFSDLHLEVYAWIRGGILVLVIYHILIYFQNKRKSYLFYSLYLFGIFVYFYQHVLVIEVGIADPSVAVPPVMDNAKSATSKSPVPPVVSYTLSLKVTVSSVLAVLMLVLAMVGADASLKLAVLLDCDVAAAFAAAS